MRNHTRAALAAAPLSLALLLAACGGDDSADPTTTTTTTEATTASSEAPASTEPPSSETTAPPPSSETTAPPETAPPSEAGSPLPEDPRDWASELVRAWGAGDRDRAAELATPEIVDQLFGHADPGGDDWELQSCDGAAGTSYCTFTSAARAEGLRTQQPTVEGLRPVATVEIAPTRVEGEEVVAADASALVRAWGAGDREEASTYAISTVVDQLFQRHDPGGPNWDLRDCLVIDGDPQCIFYDPERDERLIAYHRSDGPGPIYYVEFREGASG